VPSQEAMYAFPPPNWALAQMFDGVRSYDDIADLYSAQIGTQYDAEEVREFAASLEQAGFWYKTVQEKNILLMQRDAQKRRKELNTNKSKYGDLAQIAFPAVNPDKFLTWLHKHTAWIYTWWFTLLTLVAFAIMAGITLVHWDEIGRDSLLFFNFKEKSWRGSMCNSTPGCRSPICGKSRKRCCAPRLAWGLRPLASCWHSCRNSGASIAVRSLRSPVWLRLPATAAIGGGSAAFVAAARRCVLLSI